MFNDILQNYVTSISTKFAYEETSELGYRTDFEILLKDIFKSINVTRLDHDARAKQGNKPDFVVLKNDTPILYIETKNIGTSLDKIEKSEQMARYFGYTNLVLTDYLEFRFYRNGKPYGDSIKIADHDKKTRQINSLNKNFENLAHTLIDFTQSHKEPIRSGTHLSKIMGGKAQRIRDNVRYLLEISSKKDLDLIKLFEAMKTLLVHDLTVESFADMYAQTMVYGLFVARYHDKTEGSFSRAEARELIPNSNQFLKHFFDHIVGTEFKSSLKFIVDELCEVYSHADVGKLMEDYFKTSKDATKNYDPVIHFYEDFLKEYDPILRKKMGAYYTPQPVVDFIVKSVDQILKNDFGLAKGLADTSKLPHGKHRVQILDPATGTGTFISTIIREIYKPFKKNGQEGRWPAYVHNDLLPRIHGFELMMAPYTIAHLRLGIAFRKTGFWDFHRRLGIYLTNSLENSTMQQPLIAFGLAESIAEESREAAVIKNETPVMVVVGNPPYSVSSTNKGKWIQDLIQEYKQGLNQRKINLDDDYIKFIRYSEHFIEKNKFGVIAMITNNSFIDGITHRQMRRHLLETFDEIYILDLHGNSNKKEKSLSGEKDENVFDIQQGVSIGIFIKRCSEKKALGKVFHSDLYGIRSIKFEKLSTNTLKTIKWGKVDYTEPYYFFTPKKLKPISNVFNTTELFKVYNSGIQTKRDSLTIQYDLSSIESVKYDMINLTNEDIKRKYNLPEDGRDWKVELAKKDILENQPVIITEQYRPFDYRYSLYTGNSKGFMSYPRNIVSQHMIRDNIGLCLMKQVFQQGGFSHCLVTKNPIDERTMYSNRGGTYLIPLYIYMPDGSKIPNLNEEIVKKIEKIVGQFSPEDILDYIYAVLHSPKYREKYKEFLIIDYPKIPFPKNRESFEEIIKLGYKLRRIHLLELSKVIEFITIYPTSGTDIVEKITYKDNDVYINDNQFFGRVPELAWNFYIGGYQPAQKWLKDRKGRKLSNEDIEHYQKIIVSLVETNKIMKKIDEVIEI